MIAVMTIVTRQRGVARASVIGALWGVGHTLTIFLTGTGIILFKVAIPPRVGLSMEFADQKAYSGYNDHPHHVAFVGDRWVPEVESFLEIDYVPLA